MTASSKVPPLNSNINTRDAICNQTGEWGQVVLLHSSTASNHYSSSTVTHTLSQKVQQNFSHISCKKLLLIIFILIRLRANYLLTEALPADTVPPFLKMAGSFAKPSRVVCGLGCSSTSKLSGPENSNHQQVTPVNFILYHNRQMNYICILKTKRMKKVTYI